MTDPTILQFRISGFEIAEIVQFRAKTGTSQTGIFFLLLPENSVRRIGLSHAQAAKSSSVSCLIRWSSTPSLASS